MKELSTGIPRNVENCAWGKLGAGYVCSAFCGAYILWL